jgi:hypothetical protein
VGPRIGGKACESAISNRKELIKLVGRKGLVYASRPKIVASTKLDHFCLELYIDDIAMQDLLPIIEDKEVWDKCGNNGLLE